MSDTRELKERSHCTVTLVGGLIALYLDHCIRILESTRSTSVCSRLVKKKGRLHSFFSSFLSLLFFFRLIARSHIRTFADDRDITVTRMRKRQDKEEKHIIRMSRLMSGMAKKGGAVALRARARENAKT